MTQRVFEEFLYTFNCVDPEIVIRTSGEIRLSDFLLWQSSFSLLHFHDVYWPEFSVNYLYLTVILFQLQYKKQQVNIPPFLLFFDSFLGEERRM